MVQVRRLGAGAERALLGLLWLLPGCRPSPALDSAEAAPAETGSTSAPEHPERRADPYAEVDWDTFETLHSASHLHAHWNQGEREIAAGMGLGHLPFSDYYPSAPAYPPSPDLTAAYPQAIHAPNAEHHNVRYTGVHFNALGSMYRTGMFAPVRADWSRPPVRHSFDHIVRFEGAARPWEGVYLLQVDFGAAQPGRTPELHVTVDGARECERNTLQIVGDGRIHELVMSAPREIVLCADATVIGLELNYDPSATRVTRAQLAQGVHRPWADAFTAALDGDAVGPDGRPAEGLLYEDGGGLTLNHPTSVNVDLWKQMLDADPRVLGIEVWNQHFWFGIEPHSPHMHFYNLWETLLSDGRQVFGFFVKDHATYGRGRNVLLMPPLAELDPAEREREALRAYRDGRFFGLLGAIHVDAEGNPTPPWDHSDFRFTRVELGRSISGAPDRLKVAVGGNDQERRPNLQLRMRSDCAPQRVVSARAEVEFPIVQADGYPPCTWVRAEAFAYPSTHLGGRPLSASDMALLDVHQIARLHDRVGDRTDTFLDPAGQSPIPIVDMIFSQPIRLDR